MNDTPAEADRSFAELLRRFVAETTLLVRQELELARAEIRDVLRVAGASAEAFAVCAIFAVGAFGALTTAIIAALALAIPVWASAVVVAVVYAVIAGAGLQKARASLRALAESPPKETIQTVKDDVVAVRTGIARGR